MKLSAIERIRAYSQSIKLFRFLCLQEWFPWIKWSSADGGGWCWLQHTEQLLQKEKKERTKVKYLFEVNKPEVCLVFLSTEQEPRGIAIFLLLCLSLGELLWESTTHLHTLLFCISTHGCTHRAIQTTNFLLAQALQTLCSRPESVPSSSR